MKILQLTAHFRPNVGGVETHLGDLVNALVKRGWGVTVLTYRPLTTQTKWKIYERNGHSEIFRIPWLSNLFYKLLSIPAVEFVYLLPGLFFVTPLVLIIRNPNIIHAHGLVAGFVGVFWGRLFRKKVIVTVHSIYHFPKKGLYRKFATWIFKNANLCLGLSNQAVNEIKSLGIAGKKVGQFTYWIDLKKFKIQNSKLKVKKELGWDKKFVVLFVGRLVKEKGILDLIQAAKEWSQDIKLVIAGSGPLEENIKYQISNIKNAEFLGRIDNDKLPLYYNAADIVIIPSIQEEGFGRVILESLACGTPVIGSNRGAIPEVLDKSVGKLIDITPKNIKNAVEYFYLNRKALARLAKNCRKFAERRYSERNVETIIKAYRG